MTVSTNFDKLYEHLATGAINFSTGTFKFLLVTAPPTDALLASAALAVRSNVVSECPTSGTYTLGTGGTLTCTVALDTVAHMATVTFGSPQAFTTASLSAVGAIIYQVVGTAATDKLISYVNFGAAGATTAVTSTNGTFTTSFTSALQIKR